MPVTETGIARAPQLKVRHKLLFLKFDFDVREWSASGENKPTNAKHQNNSKTTKTMLTDDWATPRSPGVAATLSVGVAR